MCKETLHMLFLSSYSENAIWYSLLYRTLSVGCIIIETEILLIEHHCIQRGKLILIRCLSQKKVTVVQEENIMITDFVIFTDAASDLPEEVLTVIKSFFTYALYD